MLTLCTWQWALLALGAMLVGFSKTGIGGVGVLGVAIFALILPAKESTGFILPLLVIADITAVLSYRRHAQWSHLPHLFTWAVPGILIGYFAMDHMNNSQTKGVIGGILLLGIGLHFWRQNKLRRDGKHADEAVPHSFWFVVTSGMLAGFATMTANAAGGIVILYLIAMRLPKMEFLGTCAWYFFIMNTFKLPLSHRLGLINAQSLWLDLALIPFVLLGALGGRLAIPRINQRLFEQLAISLTMLSAIYLLTSAWNISGWIRSLFPM